MKWGLYQLTLIAAVGIINSCAVENTAGTSTGTENPEIKVAFYYQDEPVSVTGMLSIYSSNHNPVIQSEAIVEMTLTDDQNVSVSLENLSNSRPLPFLAKKSFKQPASEFNLVLHAGEFGNVTSDLCFNSESGLVTQNDIPIENMLRIDLKPEVDSRINLIWSNANEEPVTIFIPGTPYFMHLSSQTFVWEDLPQGFYQPWVISNLGVYYPLLSTFEAGVEQDLMISPVGQGPIQ